MPHMRMREVKQRGGMCDLLVQTVPTFTLGRLATPRESPKLIHYSLDIGLGIFVDLDVS